ncbi:MAG: DUF1997 domain-containing protein [Leptolyngbya sp. SIO1D8]|nr:DUF1997 domain-containing protein [Leptolyngbya sp. SIO1D8]
MQTPFTNRQMSNLSDQVLGAVSGLADTPDQKGTAAQNVDGHTCSPFLFRGDYAGSMEMSGNDQTVACYLDDHRAWFLRCAHPMTAEPLDDNGYALTVGRFGALGYDVEPKIGLHLLPQDQGVYRINTVPLPGYVPQGYDVDFQASLELNECSESSQRNLLTRVDWELNLKVWVHFPRFIHALPKRIIQTTGDHLLSQIVRQVSRCLTHKVQEDFHQTLDLPFPESYHKRSHHFLERFSKQPDA